MNKKHETDMPHCWCNPRKEVVEGGGMVITHRDTEDEGGLRIETVKLRGKWQVDFSFGDQTFTLDTLGKGSTKAEAEWMSGMLRKMFETYTLSIKP